MGLGVPSTVPAPATILAVHRDLETRERIAGMNTQGCHSCGATLRRGWGFAFKAAAAPPSAADAGAPGPSVRCFWCALRHPALLRRSLTASLVVGTALTLLNQGDTLLAGGWNSALYWKVPLTYCVPFVVATYGALSSCRQ
jgi:hypothetical protein